MKKSLSIIFVLIVIVVSVIQFTGCNIKDLLEDEELIYDEFPTDYDPNVDSWLQIDPTDEDVEIEWFTNFDWPDFNVSDLIYKRTGVRINFVSALSSDNSELNTMIAGNNLPDIVSLSDLGTRVQLAEEGYCYAIDGLARSYAPSMLDRVPQEHWDYYAASDGYTYCLANNFYNDSDIEEYESLGGHISPNCNIAVRKDYLEAYINHKKSTDPSFDPDTTITKPSGFIEMCLWVKNTYNLSNANPTVCLSPFPQTALNDDINSSLLCLSEMFGVPYEDSDGNLVYQYGTEEFQEVLKFLNELYTKHLVVSSNFSYEYNDINTQILNGRPFALIGTLQNVVGAIATYSKNGYNSQQGTISDDHQYVSIILTNEEGDAPLLMDYAGRGYRVSMITRNCERPDRVIKVFDYLLSEQGQREMYYGETEGEFYEYEVRPGEINPDTGEVSTFGVLRWTDAAERIFAQHNNSLLYPAGIMRKTLLTNQLYTSMTSTDNYQMINTLTNYTEYNLKCAYYDYTFERVPFRYPLETDDSIALLEHVDRQAEIEGIWIEALPKMIMASDTESLMQIYRQALNDAEQAGSAEWNEYRNRCFKAYKEYLGIQYAWPKVDPSYIEPEVKLFGCYEKYKQEMPDYFGLS